MNRPPVTWWSFVVIGGALLGATPLSLADSGSQTPTISEDSQRYEEEGQQLSQAGKYQEAAEAFRRAVESSKQNALQQEGQVRPKPEEGANTHLSQWHVGQARAYLAEQRPLQALTHAKRAKELDPASPSADRILAQAQRAFEDARGHLAQKIQWMTQAIEAERQGENGRALELWKKAHALDPKDLTIGQAIHTVQQKIREGQPQIRNAQAFESSVVQKPQVTEYLVSPGDVLEVFIWQQPDLTRDVVVRPDGRISFPLVGDMPAAGLTLTQIDDVLTKRLKTYLRFPDVSLAIRRFGGTKTVVLGEVGHAGVYVPAGEGRVLEVIAMAGGFTKDAVSSNVILIRGGLASPQVAKLNLDKALRYGAMDENIALQADDVIFVPKSTITSVLEFMEKFYPTMSQVLVGQSIATNFGTRETSGGITR